MQCVRDSIVLTPNSWLERAGMQPKIRPLRNEATFLPETSQKEDLRISLQTDGLDKICKWVNLSVIFKKYIHLC